MAKVLKQDEVDALLDLVQQTDTVDESAAAAKKARLQDTENRSTTGGFNVKTPHNVSLFDFKRPERVSRDQVTALEALHEVFARNVSATLSGYLRTLVELRLISVEQFTYSEFTMSVPRPTIFTSLTCSPLSGSMILDMNPTIIYPFIDRLLGGGSVKPHHINRPFTLIERCLINSIVSKLLEQLHETWLAIMPITFTIGEMETNPSLMQIVAPNEPVILLSFDVNMGDHSGLVNLCIPYKVIEPVIEKFSQTNWSMFHKSRSGVDVLNVLDNVGYSEVEYSVVLADVPVRMVDILNMQPGDLLDCGKEANSDISLAIGEERPYKGRPGVFKKRNAMVVSGISDSMESVLRTREAREQAKTAATARAAKNRRRSEATARAEAGLEALPERRTY